MCPKPLGQTFSHTWGAGSAWNCLSRFPRLSLLRSTLHTVSHESRLQPAWRVSCLPRVCVLVVHCTTSRWPLKIFSKSWTVSVGNPTKRARTTCVFRKRTMHIISPNLTRAQLQSIKALKSLLQLIQLKICCRWWNPLHPWQIHSRIFHLMWIARTQRDWLQPWDMVTLELSRCSHEHKQCGILLRYMSLGFPKLLWVWVFQWWPS